MNQSPNTINIIVYGTNEEDAKNIAKAVISDHHEKGVHITQHESNDVRGHLRFVGSTCYTIPCGVTDVIIAHIEGEEGQSIAQYLKDRHTVPVKIVLTSDSSLHSEFPETQGFHITGDLSAVKGLVFEKYNHHRTNLINTFNKHAKGEGLDQEGLNAVGKELYGEGYDGSNNSYLFPHWNPHLSFNQFYTWTIFGKEDDYYYRGIVDMQRELPKIHKLLSEHFGALKDVLGSNYAGKLDISPENPLPHGFKVGIESNFGDHYTEVAQKSFSNSQLCSPFTASFEIGVKDPSKVPEMVKVLNMFKDMAKEMFVVFKYLIRSGLDIQFRTENGRFFVDAVVGGLFADMVHRAIPSNVSLDSIHFSASTTFSISTGFCPFSVVNGNIEDILKAALSVSIQGTGDFMNIGTVTSIINYLIGLGKFREKEKMGLNLILSGLKVLKSTNFDLKYDCNDLFQTVSETICGMMGGSPSHDAKENLLVAGQMLAQQQMMINMFVEQGKQMTMFVADYIELIKNVNLDKIVISIASRFLKAHVKVYKDSPGLTDFLHNTFFS